MTRETAYQEVLRRAGLADDQIVNAYMYGSRVYGTARKNSDWDFVFVLRNEAKKAEQFSDNLVNVNFYTEYEHRDRLYLHEPSAMECHFLLDDFILKETWYWDFGVDLGRLRHAYSAKASNSWVKAKKKLTVEKDYNDLVGKKSLWHSLRLISFGIQIANTGTIGSYSSMNYLYDEIMYCQDWSEMYDKYKKLYNALCSDFRLVAPKKTT